MPRRRCCSPTFAGWNLKARACKRGDRERFRPYTSLRANPEFTRVVIVTRFEIETPVEPSEELNVDYQTVGPYQLGEGYTASTSGE